KLALCEYTSVRNLRCEFTGELWDPGKAAINTMALEAQSQGPGSEASTSSGLRPSKADLQRTKFSEVKHWPNTRSSLRFTKAK
ncbi:hypothetical protein QJQ45_019705, partial [Haematococcus lacustris]